MLFIITGFVILYNNKMIKYGSMFLILKFLI